MSEKYRQKYLNAYPEKCIVCSERDDIVIHHKDGDRNNNDLRNLTALCKDCHRKVHGKKSLTGRLAELQIQLPPSSLRFGGLHAGSKCIPIDSEVRDDLRGEKVGNETYSDVIARLLDDE